MKLFHDDRIVGFLSDEDDILVGLVTRITVTSSWDKPRWFRYSLDAVAPAYPTTHEVEVTVIRPTRNRQGIGRHSLTFARDSHLYAFPEMMSIGIDRFKLHEMRIDTLTLTGDAA